MRAFSLLWIAVLGAACSYHGSSVPKDGPNGTGSDAVSTQSDATPADAVQVIDAPAGMADARVTPVDAGASSTATVTCYAQADPMATCTAPDHCCFSNYDSHHNGSCSTTACAYGTISCDGPEDCGTGQHCCAHAITDPDFGTLGYDLACHTGACPVAPLDHEVCGPGGTCPSGQQCVTALGNDNDLPRTLYICQ